MFRTFICAALVTIASSAASLADDLIRKASPYTVDETIDRLASAVDNAGAAVFARVDHSAGAASVGLELPPSQLLIFGNPKLGTPAMQGSATAGLDLPLRVLAYADADGTVHLVYHDPVVFAAMHGLPADATYVQMMTGALEKLTTKAVAKD
jgi:uncharacterized protein (DUF302 family)